MTQRPGRERRRWKNGASGGPPGCLKFVAGPLKPRLLPPRFERPLPSPLPPSQLGSQIPSPVSIPPCARAPPAPSLRSGSLARRERKVNGQPQPQRQITMRKINREIAVGVPGSRRRTPLHPSPPAEAGAKGPRNPPSKAWRAEFGLPGAQSGLGCPKGGLRRIGWGPPLSAAAGEPRRPGAGDFTPWAGHAFPRASPPALSLHHIYSPAFSEPPSPRQSQRLCPAPSQPCTGRSPPPGPGPQRGGSPDAPIAVQRGPSGMGTRSRREAGTQHR